MEATLAAVVAIQIWFAINLIANSYLVFGRNPKDKWIWTQQAIALVLLFSAAVVAVRWF